jgi:hypothetical protein
MIRAVAISLLLAAVSTAGTPVRYPSPDDLALSADGKLLYVVCGGADELVAIVTEKP